MTIGVEGEVFRTRMGEISVKNANMGETGTIEAYYHASVMVWVEMGRNG